MKAKALLLQFTLATALSGAASGVLAALSSEEHKASEQMSARGVHKFLLLNKATGTLKRIEDGEEREVFSALSGRRAGNETLPDLGVTPAGVYPLVPEDDENEPYPAVAYFKEDNVSYVIHPVSGPRLKSLTTAKPDQKRMTTGCINVQLSDFSKIFRFATGPSETLIDTDGTPLVSGNFLVVLPEREPPAPRK